MSLEGQEHRLPLRRGLSQFREVPRTPCGCGGGCHTGGEAGPLLQHFQTRWPLEDHGSFPGLLSVFEAN